jgi:NTE family protein
VPRDWSVFDVADQSFDAMQGAIARQKLAAYPPDLLIEIPRNRCATMQFDRAAEMVEVGYREMQALLASI